MAATHIGDERQLGDGQPGRLGYPGPEGALVDVRAQTDHAAVGGVLRVRTGHVPWADGLAVREPQAACATVSSKGVNSVREIPSRALSTPTT